MNKTLTRRARARTGHSHSTAPTLRERRRENWGPGSTVPPTLERRFADRGHLHPASGTDVSGGQWRGAHNGPPPRKRTTAWRRKRARFQARNGWRAFYAGTGKWKPAKPTLTVVDEVDQ
jgi:hypothetical protein